MRWSNNAGVADFGPIEGTEFETWRMVMETNLDGVFLMSQALREALCASQGAIVNIASISGSARQYPCVWPMAPRRRVSCT